MIGFIGCSKSKADNPCEAKDMYRGTLFRLSYEYLSKHNAKVWILSAKYGLLNPSEIISPYNLSLKDMNDNQRKKWSEKVLSQMEGKINFNEQTVFLCGKIYYEFLIDKFSNHQTPLAKYTIDKQCKILKRINEKNI